MKIETLEEKIAKRANENVQSRVSAFKAAIDAALNELFEKSNVGGDNFGDYWYFEEDGRKDRPEYEVMRMKAAALRLAIRERDENKKKLSWPRWLWEREENAIREELLEKMDLMQKLLLTRDRNCPNDVACESVDTRND